MLSKYLLIIYWYNIDPRAGLRNVFHFSRRKWQAQCLAHSGSLWVFTYYHCASGIMSPSWNVIPPIHPKSSRLSRPSQELPLPRSPSAHSLPALNSTPSSLTSGHLRLRLGRQTSVCNCFVGASFHELSWDSVPLTNAYFFLYPPSMHIPPSPPGTMWNMRQVCLPMLPSRSYQE